MIFTMRRELVDLLACPVCKAPLTLTVTEENPDEVLAGSLHCAACDEAYPIRDGIPNLLPPELRRSLESERATAD